MSEKKPRRTTKKKRSLADLPSQPDPRASWDDAVQPERRESGPPWDEQPLPEGK